jgi:RNA polymerase-binding transcription factor DksA
MSSLSTRSSSPGKECACTANGTRRRTSSNLVAEIDGLTRRREAGGAEEGFGRVDMVSVDLDRARSRHAKAAVRLAEIDAGLARLDAGTSGRCEDCGGPMGRARLESIPEATRCVRCQGHPRRLHHSSG